MGKKKTVVIDATQEEHLITQIQERSIIWGPRHPQHKNSFALQKAWDEVIKELDFEEDSKNTVKNRWKALKKRMNLELKQNFSHSGSAASKTSDWLHYQSLLFLKDIILPNESSGNLSSYSAGDLNSDSETEFKENEVAFQDLVEQIARPTITMSKPTKKTSKADQFLTLESEKVGMMKNLMERNVNVHSLDDTVCSDDMLFFKTLRKYINKIPERDRLTLRHEVSQTVEKYAYKIQDEHKDTTETAANITKTTATVTKATATVTKATASVSKTDVASNCRKRKAIVIHDSDSSDVEIVADIKPKVKQETKVKKEKTNIKEERKPEIKRSYDNNESAPTAYVPYNVFQPPYNFVQAFCHPATYNVQVPVNNVEAPPPEYLQNSLYRQPYHLGPPQGHLSYFDPTQGHASYFNPTQGHSTHFDPTLGYSPNLNPIQVHTSNFNPAQEQRSDLHVPQGHEEHDTEQDNLPLTEEALDLSATDPPTSE